jgi:Spy/CpxP family protein refolding chaperone
MKKTISGITALLLLAAASFAQPTPGKWNKGGHFEQRDPGQRQPFSKINLTDAQKQQMKLLNDDFRKQLHELNAKDNITVKEQRDQRNALLNAHRQKVQSILTPAQKDQLAQFKADAKKRRAAMEDKHLSKLKTDLNLTETQVATIKSNQQKTQGKLELLRGDDKTNGSDKRQQLMALREEMHSNIEAVLTPEQKAKFEEIKKQNHDRKGQHGDRRRQDDVK